MGLGYYVNVLRELETAEFRREYPMAALQCIMFNAHRNIEKQKEPLDPIDFMPGWERNEEKLIATPEMLITLFGAVRADAV
jgi:hypothetical protein